MFYFEFVDHKRVNGLEGYNIKNYTLFPTKNVPSQLKWSK